MFAFKVLNEPIKKISNLSSSNRFCETFRYGKYFALIKLSNCKNLVSRWFIDLLFYLRLFQAMISFVYFTRLLNYQYVLGVVIISWITIVRKKCLKLCINCRFYDLIHFIRKMLSAPRNFKRTCTVRSSNVLHVLKAA